MDSFSARGPVVVVMMASVGCGSPSEPERATVTLSLTPGVVAPPLPMATTHCSNPGWTCLQATELSLKIGSAYLSYDVDSNGANTPAPGQESNTQAVYGNPGCGVRADSDGVIRGVDFKGCSLDLGLMSSAGGTITTAPNYLDLAKTGTARAPKSGDDRTRSTTVRLGMELRHCLDARQKVRRCVGRERNVRAAKAAHPVDRQRLLEILESHGCGGGLPLLSDRGSESNGPPGAQQRDA